MRVITRVLLVEDEEDAREILEFYLDTIFDEVEIAKDGREGVEKFKEYFENGKTFDLILTDIQMPHLNGLDMIDEITHLNEDQKFIIVSAYKDEEYLLKSISLNVVSYFVKPLEVKNMMSILKKVKEKVIEDKKESAQDTIIINSSYTYDVKSDLLLQENKEVDLSNKETLLLKALLKDITTIKTKDNLKMGIWNNCDTSDATLRTIIKRLKDKISLNDFIVSKKGKGYKIELQ